LKPLHRTDAANTRIDLSQPRRMFQGASSIPIRGWGHGASGIVGVILAVLPAMLLMSSL